MRSVREKTALISYDPWVKQIIHNSLSLSFFAAMKTCLIFKGILAVLEFAVD